MWETHNRERTEMSDKLYVEQRIANERPSVIVAYVLWFFLGVFGVHRMYLGRVVSGLMMLALTVLGFIPILGLPFWLIVGAWWLIDVVLTSSMINDDVNRMRHTLSQRP